MNAKDILFALVLLLTAPSAASSQVNAPSGYGPIPSKNQLEWQRMEYYAFIHLSVNTYTDMAWGMGDEDPIGTEDKNAYAILDGNVNSNWYQNRSQKMPIDLVIDLGKEETVSGFKYLPDQNWWATGIITNYNFYVSDDGSGWKLVDGGEFANIKNNPLWQLKSFEPMRGRYIKLQALRNTQNDDVVGYAEIDIITK